MLQIQTMLQWIIYVFLCCWRFIPRINSQMCDCWKISVYIVSLDIAKFCSRRLDQFSLPPVAYEVVQLPAASLTECAITLFNFLQSDKYEIYPSVVLICISLILSEFEHLFIHLRIIFRFFLSRLFYFFFDFWSFLKF